MSLNAKILAGFLTSSILVILMSSFGYYSISMLNHSIDQSRDKTVDRVKDDAQAVLAMGDITSTVQKISSTTNIREIQNLHLTILIQDAMHNASSLNIEQETIKLAITNLYRSRLNFFSLRNEIPIQLANTKSIFNKTSNEAIVELIKIDATLDIANLNKISDELSTLFSLAEHAFYMANNETYNEFNEQLGESIGVIFNSSQIVSNTLQSNSATNSTTFGQSIEKVLLTFVDEGGIARNLENLNIKTTSLRASEEEINNLTAQIRKSVNERSQKIAIDLNSSLSESVTLSKENQNRTLYASLVIIVISIVTGFRLSYIISKKLKTISQKIQYITKDLSTLAGSLLSKSDQITSRANDQTISLEDASHSIQDIKSRSQSNAQDASNTENVTHAAKEIAEVGVSEMREMEVAMQRIQQSSTETSDIIKTIEEIAFQTNILALNAAVEAARAGTAGAGFAVVADEVRSLAQRSSDAAHITNEKIQHAVQNTTQSMEYTVRIRTRLEEILTQSIDADKYVSQIKSSLDDETIRIDEISNSIDQVESSTRQTARFAEETTGSAKELNTHANKLYHTVASLKELLEGATPSVKKRNASKMKTDKKSRLKEQNRVKEFAGSN